MYYSLIRRRTFSLRRMLLGFVAFGAACAVGREVHERLYVQDQAIRGLHELGCELIYESPPVKAPAQFLPQAANEVTRVHLRAPFRSAGDAGRVNTLLKRLPNLRHVSVSPTHADHSAAAAVHAGIALRGLALRRF